MSRIIKAKGIEKRKVLTSCVRGLKSRVSFLKM